MTDETPSTSDGEGAAGVEDTKVVETAGGGMHPALAAAPEKTGREVSAATVGRMLGLATALEVKVAEQKIDLLSAKVNAMSLKLDKVFAVVSGMPGGGDLERIDLQIGQLKSLVREVLTTVADGAGPGGGPGE